MTKFYGTEMTWMTKIMCIILIPYFLVSGFIEAANIKVPKKVVPDADEEPEEPDDNWWPK